MKRSSTPQSVLPSIQTWALHDACASRLIEARATAAAPPHALMERAGLAVARLAMAVAPGARSAWIAAGPGNNGGDGMVAARHLHAAGWSVRVTLLGDPARMPTDAAWALHVAREAGVPIRPALDGMGLCDLAIDALLGLGASRPPEGAMAATIARLNSLAAPVLAVDLPSGLCGDRGVVLGSEAVRSQHTLSLLTLKPGLFTAQGRDHAGRVWCDLLAVDVSDVESTAQLIGPPAVVSRRHAEHKGSYGDVIVLGGASGMGGAALLAARAALTAGAGRVYLARLDGRDTHVDAGRPELMPRSPAEAMDPSRLAASTLVCGCGGGSAVREWMPAVLHHAARLVLDADALNAVAQDPGLAMALARRTRRGLPTVLTPHPLEAARLLHTGAPVVQADRLTHALALARKFSCHVVLKGSGTVVAGPDGRVRVNPTGNARLGSAGTGDVLAGWLGGAWSLRADALPLDVASETVWWHGHAADVDPAVGPLLAADLISAMHQVQRQAEP